jgi:SAM-dependent methyltransferase
MSGYGSVAKYFDGEYDGFRQDIDFYLDRLQADRVRGPVLEPGCGTGRVVAPLAAAGFRVSGFDTSEGMLRRARRRRAALAPDARLRLRFSRQDMVDFEYRHRFRAVILAFSTFNLLADASGRHACLRRVADHLEPGGLLLADLFNPGAPAAAAPRRRTTTFRMPPHGHIVEKAVEEVDDPGGGATTVRYTYQERRWLDDTPVDQLQVEFRLARVCRHDMEAVLYEAGFDVEAVVGDYSGRPFSERSPRMILQARRLR